jgi:four helix bundle protein
MNNFQTVAGSDKKYDLEERTAKFAENVISFCRSVRQDFILKPLILQLVRSGTSIGANYCESNNASSKKDFRNKIFICKKEVQETKYWLQLIGQQLGNEEKIALECYGKRHKN